MSSIAENIERADPDPEPTFWLLQTIDGRETRELVGNLVAGRAAWLAAMRGGRATYATLVGEKDGCSTWPCEWSKAGSFHDRTEALR